MEEVKRSRENRGGQELVKEDAEMMERRGRRKAESGQKNTTTPSSLYTTVVFLSINLPVVLCLCFSVSLSPCLPVSLSLCLCLCLSLSHLEARRRLCGRGRTHPHRFRPLHTPLRCIATGRVG